MREDPTERAAPVMCEEQRSIEMECFDEGFDVVSESEDVVAFARLIGSGITAQIRRVDARVLHFLHERTPAHRAFRKAVQAKNRGAIRRSGHSDTEVYAVGVYVKMFDCCGQEDSLQSGLQTGCARYCKQIT